MCFTSPQKRDSSARGAAFAMTDIVLWRLYRKFTQLTSVVEICLETTYTVREVVGVSKGGAVAQGALLEEGGNLWVGVLLAQHTFIITSFPLHFTSKPGRTTYISFLCV